MKTAGKHSAITPTGKNFREWKNTKIRFQKSTNTCCTQLIILIFKKASPDPSHGGEKEKNKT
jgi:hypothetical protein